METVEGFKATAEVPGSYWYFPYVRVSFCEDRAAAVACVGEPEVGDLFPWLVSGFDVFALLDSYSIETVSLAFLII